MTSIEYSDYALAFSSSFGAITAILHLLKTGDHLIVCDEV
jgi:cystathionine beta-lyase/cystathionine gamma-synthase